jgi:hypothetical protein
MEVKMHERMMRTKTGQLPLKYFDGAIMQSYQMPSRASEVMFCRNQNVDCQHGLDPGVRNVPLASLRAVEKMGIIITLQDIDQGTLVGMEWCVHEMDVHAMSLLVSKEHMVNGFSDTLVTDIYNPFHSRTAFTRACVNKCTMATKVAAGEKVEGVTAWVRDTNVHEARKGDPKEESPPVSNDTVNKNRPNLDSAAGNCSKNLETGERECIAAAIYETAVKQ